MRSYLITAVAAGAAASLRVAEAAAWWEPPVNTTWQWQLQFQVNTSFQVDMYDVDLFDVSTSTFDEMKAMGSVVICYFSAGTQEDWRDDAHDFPAAALGEPLGDWAGEVWVDVNNEGVRAVMEARLDLAAEKGCDGVEPDNVQVYLEGNSTVTGVNVSAAQQLDYNKFLAEEAHLRNLSIGLKNELEHMVELEPFFDWGINESCFEYDECDIYATTFIKANKAVFHAEYEQDNLDFCVEANAMGLSSLLKSYDLGPERCSCQDPSTDNQCGLLLEEGEVPPPTSTSSSDTSSETTSKTSSEASETPSETEAPTLESSGTPAPTVAVTVEPVSAAGRRFAVGEQTTIMAVLVTGASAALGAVCA